MLPLAAGVLLPWISSLTIPPLWGSAFMSISSIVVVLCSNMMPLVFKRPEEMAKKQVDYDFLEELISILIINYFREYQLKKEAEDILIE